AEDTFCFGVDADAAYQESRLDRIVPFRIDEPIALGISERLIRIDTVEVTGYPREGDVRKAEGRPNDMAKLTLVFTYANRGKKNWTCEYVVTVLDGKGEELGRGERKASLDAEQREDTNR